MAEPSALGRNGHVFPSFQAVLAVVGVHGEVQVRAGVDGMMQVFMLDVELPESAGLVGSEEPVYLYDNASDPRLFG